MVLCASEVDQHWDVFIRGEDVDGSGGNFSTSISPRDDRAHSIALCTTPRVWRNLMSLKSAFNHTPVIGSPTLTGMKRKVSPVHERVSTNVCKYGKEIAGCRRVQRTYLLESG